MIAWDFDSHSSTYRSFQGLKFFVLLVSPALCWDNLVNGFSENHL